jgi:hypothetical protein
MTNTGKVPIEGIQIDPSAHTVDRGYPVPGQEGVMAKVKSSNYWSNAFQVREQALNPGDSARFDLTKMAQWQSLPDSPDTTRAVSEEKLEETFRTYFVFRFTFRHAGTGQRYACYKVHGSYLKYPSPVDDNSGASGSADALRFYNKLREVIVDSARERYNDGADEIRCE